MPREVVARALSIVGHPFVVMPLAVLVATAGPGVSPAVRAGAVGMTALVVLLILGVSLRRVKSGRWSHVDASDVGERGQLNMFLIVLLLGAALLLRSLGESLPLVAGLGIGGVIALSAFALRRWLKASLHVAFGFLAMGILWGSTAGAALLAVLIVAVAWSRIELGRHTVSEVLAGAALGALGGVVFQLFLRAA